MKFASVTFMKKLFEKMSNGACLIVSCEKTSNDCIKKLSCHG